MSVMAQSGVAITSLAQAAGFNPATVDRQLRDLRAHGMAPVGRHGRGRQHGQYTAEHLAYALLGFAGPLPSDAAEEIGRAHV